jgi:hypothetical protein
MSLYIRHLVERDILMQANQRKIKVEMPKDPSGTYANTVMISHNQHEVFFDFIQIMPHDARARVQQRIVMTPIHAKMFLKALEENMQRYEEKFNEIEVPQRPPSLADQLFQSIASGGDEDE